MTDSSTDHEEPASKTAADTAPTVEELLVDNKGPLRQRAAAGLVYIALVLGTGYVVLSAVRQVF
jgi:hypothetical protein